MKYPHVKQHDSSDCAAACAKSICEHYGKNVSITKMRELLGTDRSGTTMYGIKEAFTKMGFNANSRKVDKASIGKGIPTPAIAHIVKKNGITHYVVIVSVKKDRMLIMDPAEDSLKWVYTDDIYPLFSGQFIFTTPNENFIAGKTRSYGVFSLMRSIVKIHKKLFISAFIASVLLTVFGVLMAIFNRILIDDLIPYHHTNQLTIWAIVLLVVVVFQILLQAARQQILIHLSKKIGISLTSGYFRHVFSLSMDFFYSRKTGEILTRHQDSAVIQSILTSVVLTVIIDIAMVAIVGVFLYLMSPALFLIVALMTILSAILIFFFRPPYKKLNKESMEQQAKLNSQIVERLNNIETVKTYSSEEYTMEKIEKEFAGTVDIGVRTGTLSNIQSSLSSGVGGIGNLGILMIGAFMVINGEATLGTLIAFMSLSGFFIEPINRLVGLQLSIQEAGISLDRLIEIYEVEKEETSEEEKDKSVIADGINEMTFKDVSFRYGSRPLTLKDVSMVIPKGKKIAVVGPSGCGKTTLSYLMLKFHLPEKGKITVNNADIKELDAFAIRREIGYVSQKIELFSGSISENLREGKNNATHAEILTACKLAGCDFIDDLPMGLNTVLSENGEGLSGGEKQRISLARTLVKNPDFLILDEATSNMDFMAEQYIYRTLFSTFRDKTMLIIAHRLNTIKKCDLIYVMDNGTIVESGTHDELVAAGNLYTEMWKAQTGIGESE